MRLVTPMRGNSVNGSAGPASRWSARFGPAVTAGKRVSGLESVPTMAESYPGFEYVGWFALVAPAGTPEPVVRKVNADVNAVLAKDEIQKRLLELGAINEGPASPE